MLRRLVISSIAALTSLALVSSAAAMIPTDPGYGPASTPVTSTPTGFPWTNVALGLALAVAVAVCLAGALYLSRNRRRLAALHS
jgi:hypothetical protein